MIYRYHHENGPDFCIDLSDLSYMQIEVETLVLIFKSKNEPIQLHVKSADHAWEVYYALSEAWKTFSTLMRFNK